MPNPLDSPCLSTHSDPFISTVNILGAEHSWNGSIASTNMPLPQCIAKSGLSSGWTGTTRYADSTSLREGFDWWVSGDVVDRNLYKIPSTILSLTTSQIVGLGDYSEPLSMHLHSAVCSWPGESVMHNNKTKISNNKQIKIKAGLEKRSRRNIILIVSLNKNFS